MKKQTAFNITLVLAGWVMMACTCTQNHIYYSPPSQNVPMLKEANELTAEVGSTGGKHLFIGPSQALVNSITCEPEYTSGIYFQGAYSPKQNWGASVNFMQAHLSQSTYENNNGNVIDVAGSGKGYAFDGGCGYYTTLDKLVKSERFEKVTGKIILETYGGLGYSGQEHAYRDSIYSASASLKSFIFYVQPAVGINLRWITFAISARLNNFYYHGISTQYPANYPGSTYATRESDFVDYLKRRPLQTFLEPAFTIKGGWKYVKLSFQYCGSQVITTGQPSYGYETERVSLGLNVNIAPRYKKQVKKQELLKE